MNPIILMTEAITIPEVFFYVARNALGGLIPASLILLVVITVLIYKANLPYSVALIAGFVLFFALFITAEDIYVSMFALSLMFVFGLIGFAMLYFSRRG